jgi:predicted Na+-dependent transporter
LAKSTLEVLVPGVFSITSLLKTDSAAVIALRRCAKHWKAVKIAVMLTQIQISELAWFSALFIEADHSTLAGKSHVFIRENCQLIPQGLRYGLR